MSRRVVITGLGLVSPLGNCKAALWDALFNARSGVDTLTVLPADESPVKFGAEVRDFSGHIDDFGVLEKNQKRALRKGIKVMSREIQMGVAAAQLALNDANLSLNDYDSERTGCVYGSDYIITMPAEFTDAIRSCQDETGQFRSTDWAKQGLPKVTPLWLLKYLPNMPASHIAIYNDLRGPNNSLTAREASANLAIAEAYTTLCRGAADTIVAGATGMRVHPMRAVHASLQEQLATADDPKQASRPFDKDRTGMVLGEGAGAIVLEELETARARGARLLGEVIGYGSSTVVNGRGIVDSRQAISNAIQQCLKTAGIAAAEIGHVHAHGLSTLRGDTQEAQAIADSMAERQDPVPVTAAKSYFGNLGAGGGAVELIASVMAMEAGTLFPVLNCTNLDPACPINVVQSTGISAGDAFMNLSVTPQGQASGVVVRRPPS